MRNNFNKIVNNGFIGLRGILKVYNKFNVIHAHNAISLNLEWTKI